MLQELSIGILHLTNQSKPQKLWWTGHVKCCFGVILLMLLPNMVGAAVREVGSGKTYSTIQAAIDTASCGDTVIVYAGAYGSFSTTQHCTSGAYLTIQAKSGETVTLNTETKINHRYHKMIGFTIRPTNGRCVTIDRVSGGADGSYFEFRNNDCCPAGANNGGVVYPWHQTDFGPVNTVIDGNKFGPCSTAMQASIRIRGDGHTVTNNIFDYWKGHDGIYMLCSNSTFRGNEFKNRNHMVSESEHPDCFQVQHAADEVSYGNIIEQNYFHHNVGQIIYTEDTATQGNNIVRNNLFAICGAKSIQTSGPGWKIDNNTFLLCSKNTSHPVGFRANSSGSELKNNIFVGNGSEPTSNQQGWVNDDSLGVSQSNNYVAGKGALFGAKDKNYTLGSTLNLASDSGLVNGGNPKFVNAPVDWVFSYFNGVSYGGDANHFEVSTTDAAKFVVGEYAEYCPYVSGCDGIPRVITGKSSGIIAFSPAISDYVAPDCGSSIGPDRCGIYVVLWGSNNTNCTLDLRLTETSPAINAGVGLNGFATDFAGTIRPQGSAWDIGAYEYKGGPAPASPANYVGDSYNYVSVWGLDTGKIYTYLLTAKQYSGKRVGYVKEDGTDLARVVSKDLCESTNGSYYFDSSSGQVYIHSRSGVDPKTLSMYVYHD